MSGNGPASWSTWTSRRSAASPTTAAGEPTAGPKREANRDRSVKIGFDDVHSLVDDHSRLAYSEILPDEKGPTCAGLLDRAITYFAHHGITRIERPMTGNAWAHRCSLREICAEHGIRQKSIKPYCSWQNGKVELDRTLQTDGPTGNPSPATPNAPQPLHPGSSTTTLNAATAHSADTHPPADCHQPDGQIHLGRV
ncbi:DDE-type integrase/transposase/recombinase [Amycolatopsis sp. DSM 110486]|nr:DDE-type integrase/transposase/recombinase [Amycolatopsis sp. DSM 110486]